MKRDKVKLFTYMTICDVGCFGVGVRQDGKNQKQSKAGGGLRRVFSFGGPPAENRALGSPGKCRNKAFSLRKTFVSEWMH